MATLAPYDPSTGMNTTLPNALLGPDPATQNAERQRQALALALQSRGAGDYSAIQSPWQGVARLVNGLMGGLQVAAANRAQTTGQNAANTSFSNLFNGVGSAPIAGALSDIPSAPVQSQAPSVAENNAALAGGAPPVPPENIGVDQFLHGIGQEESGNRYLPHPNETGAVGRYQMTQPFLDQYAEGAGYPGATTKAIISDPAAQDTIARHAATALYDKYGDWGQVANAWLTGSPTKIRTDPYTGIRSDKYTANVLKFAGQPPGGDTAPQEALSYAAPTPIPRPLQLAGDVPSLGAVPVPPPRPAGLDATPPAAPAPEPGLAPQEIEGKQALAEALVAGAARNNAAQPPAPGALTPNERGALAGTPTPTAALPPVASAGGPSISVPGYDGKFTRAQSNDAEGAPSAAEWDAAAKGSAPAVVSPAAPAPIQAAAPAPAPAPISAPPRAAPQPPALPSVAQPSLLQSLANALGGGGQTVPDGRGGSVPITNSRYDPATGNFLPAAAQATALARALSGAAPAAAAGLSAPSAAVPTAPTAAGSNLPPAAPSPSASVAPTSNLPQTSVQNGISRAQAAAASQIINNQYASPAAKQIAAEILKTYMVPRLPPQTATAGEGILNPQTGKYEIQIPKDDKETQTSEIKNWNAVNANRKELGQPPIALNDFILEKSAAGKGTNAPLMGTDGKPVDPSLSGSSVLDAIPPAIANHAKALLETREQWPSGFAQARNPQLQQALAAAQQADPELDQTKYAARQAMRKDTESGNGRINLANVANNTALNHSATLAGAIVNLNNTNSTDANSIVQALAPHLGFLGSSFVDKADAVKQFNTARDALSNELEKSFHGVGSTAEQAVKRQIDNLVSTDAPQTQLGALKEAQSLLAGKIGVNEENYKTTMGEHGVASWERENKRPFGFVTPEAQNAADRVSALYSAVKAHGGLGGGIGMESPPQASAHLPAEGAVRAQQGGAPTSKVRVFNPATGNLE